jgi:hypothetical protein
MIEDRISQIEARIQNSASITPEKRIELLKLLAELKSEMSPLSQTHQEQLQSIAGFTEVTAYEAMREAKRPDLLRHSVRGLQSSVDEFEKSHPQLVAVVNRLASMLSNMGI